MPVEQTRCWIFVFLWGALSMVSGYVEIEAASNACYDARSRTFSACSGVYDRIFYAPVDGTIEGVKLVHNSGAVQCYTHYHNYYTLSNWGLCAHVGVIIMSVIDETNYLGNILYPVNGETDGLYYWFPFPSAANDNDGTIPNSYEISGYDQESDYLIFMGPEYEVSKMDKFMLQYTEAYVRYSYSDNVGVGYASVYFLYADPTSTIEPTQLTHQSTEPNNPTTTVVALSSHNTVYSRQKLSIEIDCVPEYGAGPSSWGLITGKCGCVDIVGNISETVCSQSDVDWATNYSVVIYSITNTHYIQPFYNDYYTTISDSGLWSRWIHLGYEYEVDLVEFEDRYSVIETDLKDASDHYPECIQYPSETPSDQPSSSPTKQPTDEPSTSPSDKPSASPSKSPTPWPTHPEQNLLCDVGSNTHIGAYNDAPVNFFVQMKHFGEIEFDASQSNFIVNSITCLRDSDVMATVAGDILTVSDLIPRDYQFIIDSSVASTGQYDVTVGCTSPSPTQNPSDSPTKSPSNNPSASPTTSAPSTSPSDDPTTSPTKDPSASPSHNQTTKHPSLSPTDQPSSPTTSTIEPTQLTHQSTEPNNPTTTVAPRTSDETYNPTTGTHTTLAALSSHNTVYSHQKLSIEIDCVPEYGAGPSSWGLITGKCNCVDIVGNISATACSQSDVDWSTNYSVVIYSITNTHYIQPFYDDYYTTVSDSGLWSRWIHLGYEYEVDLVEFEDRYSVIETDLKDASEHYPECTQSTNNPSETPSATPSKTASATTSQSPSDIPTNVPTSTPSNVPSATSSAAPSPQPSRSTLEGQTHTPTDSPTEPSETNETTNTESISGTTAGSTLAISSTRSNMITVYNSLLLCVFAALMV